ncbi:hypothetical protein [Nocardioides sp. LHG3406-4]|uniref:hypothetical protein n=1 Tax=Nocardioides sp. LHG3406-4 TaxID=2804575 RepID=UPI003CEBE024
MRLRRKQTLMDRASEFAESVLPQIESALESALESGKESARDAQAKAAPLIAQGRQIATEKAAEAAAVAADKASTGASIAAEKASIGRDLAAARVATLRGQEPEPKGGKLKKFLLFGGLLALGGFLFNKLRGQTEDSWESSYTPTPAPTSPSTSTPGTHAAPGTSDDSAGGTPGEAVADAVEEPHPSTTPDDPATVIDVDDARNDKS